MAVPLPVVGDIIRVRLTASINGQTAVWGTDQKVSAVAGAGITLPALANKIGTASDTFVPASLANTVLVGSPIVELVDPLTGVVTQSALGTSSHPFGSGGATCAPTQAAAVVQKLTGLAGPSNRGRMFWPFLPTAFISTAGRINSTGRTDVKTAADTMFLTATYTVGADSVTLSPILLHRTALGGPASYEDLTGFFVSTKLGTQKRRGDYGRTNPPY